MKKYNSFYPGNEWLDTAGKPIQAHGFHIFFDKNLNEYYLYTTDDYINLKLYLNKDVDQITISAYTMDGTNIYNIVYIISEQ